MQTNTPAPVTRNRRSGRLSPANDASQPQAVPDYPASGQTPLQPLHQPQGAAAPQYRRSAPAPVQQSPYTDAASGTYYRAPVYPTAQQQATPQQPSVPCRAEQQTPVRQNYADPLAAYNDARTAYRQSSAAPAEDPYRWNAGAVPTSPRVQAAPQPTARRTAAAPIPTQTHTVPASSRPLATSRPMRMRQDDPDARRAAKNPPRKEAPVKPAADVPAKPAKKPEEKVVRKRTPSWLKSLLSVMLVGVMALVAFSAVMLASLKTWEKEQQQAWENVLFEYHLTEEADAALRVTWQNLIEHYAGVYNLDPAFVTAIIRNESSFRTDAVSSVGARGLMQMMPDTAEWIAGKLNEPFDFDKLFEAETAIRYGCWYLDFLADLFGGDTVLVCAAYHAGQGEVLGWLGDTSISPDGVSVPIANIPITNTRIYAERVTKAYGVYDALLYPEEPVQTPAVHGAHSAAAELQPVR